MVDLSKVFFTEHEMALFIKGLDLEAKQLENMHAKMRQFKERTEKAKASFYKQQDELLNQKRKKDSNTSLTVEERDKIWGPYNKIHREIAEDIFGK